MSNNQIIGDNNNLPWHLPEDLKFFKKTTTGACVIMGRKTFESIGKALPKRTNIILTRNPKFTAPDCLVASNLTEAILLAQQGTSVNQSLFIIGGADVYEQALPLCEKLYITVVDTNISGDSKFCTSLATLQNTGWHAKAIGHQPVDEKHCYAFTNYLLEKNPNQN